MFGANPRRAPEPAGAPLWVQEVFYTLQGEGPFLGRPAVFVRLGGCNLACWFCDTEFESSAWRPEPPELLEAVKAAIPAGARCALVVVSGGEPLRQAVGPFVALLLAEGFAVQFETNGTLWTPLPDDPRVSFVVSPKTARVHPEVARRAIAYKYVVAAGELDPEDGLPLTNMQRKGGEPHRLARPEPGSAARVMVMPLDAQDPEANARHAAAALGTALAHGYDLTLQAHKHWRVP